jgi:hypothetical protein
MKRLTMEAKGCERHRPGVHAQVAVAVKVQVADYDQVNVKRRRP